MLQSQRLPIFSDLMVWPVMKRKDKRRHLKANLLPSHLTYSTFVFPLHVSRFLTVFCYTNTESVRPPCLINRDKTTSLHLWFVFKSWVQHVDWPRMCHTVRLAWSRGCHGTRSSAHTWPRPPPRARAWHVAHVAPGSGAWCQPGSEQTWTALTSS